MIKTILIIVLIVYSVSITGLFLILRKMFNDYIQVTDLKIKQHDLDVNELQKGASLTNHRIEL
ncbi:hypothetical protein VXG46_001302 [Acinetobacter baumannii]|uniref:hypothetical protein n=1 Tax=Acinetobacter TaxID=469 RepID=UPI00226EC2E7|nr:hypothetical protein [Acinetobacter baumannii]EMC7950715.1 hypothetical protein [Acinetobacter baumannii]EMD9692168.1 hypothetical protein [Acinetobacter baumannii]MCY0274100.1 hypothetical protein [Acinetobacter baumannii]HAV5548734.1 hypothetical protein [Acinetobacter baumannii]HDJ7835243.1 hypothetical protein [Acinetobacter baumannii]